MTDHYWAYLAERSLQEYAASALVNIAMRAGGNGYKRLVLPYMRTDASRNRYVESFCKLTSDPESTLVMLDCDHNHPQDILDRLIAHDMGVVGALAFRRCEPFDPCAMFRGADGHLHSIATWEEGATTIPCTVVGTGAIAIKRWVFDALKAKGHNPPYFKYYYPDGTQNYPTEDVYFGLVCDDAGIAHHVDVTLVTPHMTVGEVDAASWSQWLADHPEDMLPIDDIGFEEKSNERAAK